jgi:hypothetical protein
VLYSDRRCRLARLAARSHRPGDEALVGTDGAELSVDAHLCGAHQIGLALVVIPLMLVAISRLCGRSRPPGYDGMSGHGKERRTAARAHRLSENVSFLFRPGVEWIGRGQRGASGTRVDNTYR